MARTRKSACRSRPSKNLTSTNTVSSATTLVVRDSALPGAGRGLFVSDASPAIREGTWLAEFTGKRLTDDEVDALPDNYDFRYLIQARADTTLDGSSTDDTNLPKFINSLTLQQMLTADTEFNCEFMSVPADDTHPHDRVLVKAMKQIKPGQELLAYYGWHTNKVIAGQRACIAANSALYGQLKAQVHRDQTLKMAKLAKATKRSAPTPSSSDAAAAAATISSATPSEETSHESEQPRKRARVVAL
jgi:hypothetical protein